MEAVTITQITPPELETLIENSIRKVLSGQTATTPTETDQQLTIKQAGDFLNLSVHTLYGYVHRADIPVCKRGKRLYFSKQELTDWIRAGRKKTFTETAIEAQQYLLTKKGLNNGK